MTARDKRDLIEAAIYVCALAFAIGFYSAWQDYDDCPVSDPECEVAVAP